VAQHNHECGECGGRLLDIKGKDGRIWYRCEHSEHCGNFLAACSSCGTGLPRRDEHGSARCSCGVTNVACPQCADGWLIEKSGRFGKFLGCVRHPSCSATSKLPKP